MERTMEIEQVKKKKKKRKLTAFRSESFPLVRLLLILSSFLGTDKSVNLSRCIPKRIVTMLFRPRAQLFSSRFSYLSTEENYSNDNLDKDEDEYVDKNRGGKKSAVRSVKKVGNRKTRGGLVEKKNIRKGVPSFGKKKKRKKKYYKYERKREKQREKNREKEGRVIS